VRLVLSSPLCFFLTSRLLLFFISPRFFIHIPLPLASQRWSPPRRATSSFFFPHSASFTVSTTGHQTCIHIPLARSCSLHSSILSSLPLTPRVTLNHPLKITHHRHHPSSVLVTREYTKHTQTSLPSSLVVLLPPRRALSISSAAYVSTTLGPWIDPCLSHILIRSPSHTSRFVESDQSTATSVHSTTHRSHLLCLLPPFCHSIRVPRAHGPSTFSRCRAS